MACYPDSRAYAIRKRADVAFDSVKDLVLLILLTSQMLTRCLLGKDDDMASKFLEYLFHEK